MDTITIKQTTNKELEIYNNSSQFLFNIALPSQIEQKQPSTSPKPLLLVSLGGCTALDVISLMSKMKVTVAEFDVEVCGEISKSKPYVYTQFGVCYNFTIEGLPDFETKRKLKKIVEMSQERFCALSAMLRKVAPIKYSVNINNHNIESCACRH